MINKLWSAVFPRGDEGKITHETCRAWLTLDALSRRAVSWPLVPEHILLEALRHTTANAPPIDGNDVIFTSVYRDAKQFERAKPLEQFDKRLLDAFPCLPAIFSLAEGRILAAGGAVVRALNDAPTRYYHDAPDVDLFIHSCTEAEAVTLLKTICAAVFDDQGFSVELGRHCLSVSDKKRNVIYQFILRLYPSPDQILGGFDLACCAVGWSPETGLVATPLGAFSLASWVNIVDTTRRSKSFEHRLYKYSQRRFRVIFPSLDPQCDVTAAMSHNTKLTFYGRNGMQEWSMYVRSSQQETDYGPSTHPAILAYSNIIRAACNQDFGSAEIVVSGKSLPEVLLHPMVPGYENIDSLYQKRKTRNHQQANIPVLQLYKRWFGPDANEYVVAKMNEDEAAIDAVVKRTVARIKQTMERLAKDVAGRGLHFITQDPGRQYTGSFNPILEHPTVFYGTIAYRPTFVYLHPDVYVLLRLIGKQFRVPKDVISYMSGFVSWAVASDYLDKVGYGSYAR